MFNITQPRRKKENTTTETSRRQHAIGLSYISKLSEQVARIFKSYDIPVYHKPINTLRLNTKFLESDNMAYEKILNKGPTPCYYIKVVVELEDGADLTVTAAEFKVWTIISLQMLFGEAGKSVNVDVLKYDKKTHKAILRVQHRGFVKLWSSLALRTTFAGIPCVLHVLQVSGHLMALAADSRTASSI
ncbi:hypothetical protein LSAT2_031963 [Lamellibrachia satsuma]|nr:hypothetical protein LSAT2_031963 [Lamellibrachia satsuma]